MKNNKLFQTNLLVSSILVVGFILTAFFQLPRQLPGIAGEHRTSILPDSGGNLLSAVGNAYKAGKHFADNGS